MTKYRLLTIDELKELEKEFINYLILNGLTADDWEKIKNEAPDKAQNFIEQFSDLVFERIITKVEYLEQRTPKELKTFQCLKDKIVLVGMYAEADSEADFTNAEYIRTAAVNPPDSLKVYTTEKTYTQDREKEIFDLVQSGCLISDGRLFKALCLSLPGK